MQGTVKTIVAGRGFGFIRATDGTEYFFHRTGVLPRHQFDSMQEGDAVSFSVETHDKGPRAVKVQTL